MDSPKFSLTGRGYARLRRVIQIIFLALFGWLFLKAEFGGQENLAWPVDLFFRFDPLILATQLLTLSPLVVAAERGDRRFWCRALCPLGALYGLIARFSRLRRRPGALCPDCGDCIEVCKMAAFAPGKPARHLTSECQLCLRCLEACQKEDRVHFTWTSKAPRAPLDLGRRQVITTVAAGAVAVPFLRLGSLARRPDAV